MSNSLPLFSVTSLKPSYIKQPSTTNNSESTHALCQLMSIDICGCRLIVRMISAQEPI